MDPNCSQSGPANKPLECLTSLQSDSWDHLADEPLNRILTGVGFGEEPNPRTPLSQKYPRPCLLSIRLQLTLHFHLSVSVSPALPIRLALGTRKTVRGSEGPVRTYLARCSSRPQGAL